MIEVADTPEKSVRIYQNTRDHTRFQLYLREKMRALAEENHTQEGKRLPKIHKNFKANIQKAVLVAPKLGWKPNDVSQILSLSSPHVKVILSS
jgi:hypothetical protein